MAMELGHQAMDITEEADVGSTDLTEAGATTAGVPLSTTTPLGAATTPTPRFMEAGRPITITKEDTISTTRGMIAPATEEADWAEAVAVITIIRMVIIKTGITYYNKYVAFFARSTN